MRKFKLFSYLLIAGMLFSNANMYAMEGQNQNLGNEENQTQERRYTIFLPFYDGAAKTIFSPQDGGQKKLLASFINELFPGAIPDPSCIQSLSQQYNFNKTNSSEGTYILDIPFKVEYYNAGTEKTDFYDLEIQQYLEQDMESRFRKYSVALRSANDCDVIQMIALLNLKNYHSCYHGEAKFNLATGKYESKIDDGTKLLFLNADYYSSPDSKKDGNDEDRYFNNHKLPNNGWMAFFDFCSKSGKLQNIGSITCITIENILLDNYNEDVQEAIKLLDILNDKSKNLIALIKNEQKAVEGIIGSAKEQGRQEGLKEGLEQGLEQGRQEGAMIERKKNIVYKLAKRRTAEEFAAKRQTLLEDGRYNAVGIQSFIREQNFNYYQENNFDGEQIAKELKLSSQEQQGS